MRLLPGLTSTDPAAFESFLGDLALSPCREIAFFPTCLDMPSRQAAYRALESIPGLAIPHVHLRSDMGVDELSYLAGRFGTEVFNVHAQASLHPYTGEAGPWRDKIFVENADALPVARELEGLGGLCLDYAHWESARLLGTPDYSGFAALASGSTIGCCHISAVRPGIRSSWGGYDHHRFADPSELDYVLAYRPWFPGRWASLELENSLKAQLDAIARLEGLLARA